MTENQSETAVTETAVITTATVTEEPTRWSMLRDELRARREARAAHKQLVRELASYRTQTERDDLIAVLDRYDDDVTADLRRIMEVSRLQAA